MNTTIYIYVNKMIKRFINKPKKNITICDRYKNENPFKLQVNYKLQTMLCQ